jgi:PAS domain S-box-containing protein
MSERCGVTGTKKTKAQLLEQIRDLKVRIKELESRLPQGAPATDLPPSFHDPYRVLLDASADVGILVDCQGFILAASYNASRVYGVSPPLTGLNLYSIAPPWLSEEQRPLADEVCRNGKPVRTEVLLNGKNYENAVYPVWGEAGTVTSLALYLFDITERKQIEAALQRAEQKYRNIFENAIEGIFQTNPQGRFISANPSLARIHGYGSPDELLEGITDLAKQLYVDPADRRRFVGVLAKNGAVQNFEVQMHKKDGSLHWISINARAVRDTEGRDLCYEGTMLDISARKAAEQALAESEERYRTAIDHSNDGVAIIQGDMNTYVNRRFVEMFGFSRKEDIVGKSVTVVVHPDDLVKVRTINSRRQRGEPVPSRYEFKGIRVDGAAIYVEVSAADIAYRGKTFYLVYMRDVTERKRAEEDLKNERNRFQTLSENAPYGIAMIARDGTFTYINPRFRELFGYDREEIPNGRAWLMKAYPDPEYRKKVIIDWKSDLRNLRPGEKVPRTFDVTCRDGSVKTINFVPVRLVTGEHIISFDDITDRIKAQQSLIRSHQELERLNRAKTKAVHHISHELKTPLAVIQGNLRLLKNKLKTSEAEGGIRSIMEALDRNLNRLFVISRETDEIFTVSHELEAGNVLDELDRLWQRMENFPDVPSDIRSHWKALRNWMNQYLSGSRQSFQSIDLYPLVLKVVERSKEAAFRRNLRIEAEGENDLYISMDPFIVRETLMSLIKNAVESTPDGGLIRVSVEQKGDEIIAQVTDCGIGIREEDRQYIFDGLHPTGDMDLYASRQPYDFGAGGKGLELLLVKAYAQRFGFEVTFETRRCTHVSSDRDPCPSAISECSHCTDSEDCLRSGGTTFTAAFPAGSRPPPDRDGTSR